MIKKWEQDYLIKTAQTLQAVTDRRNTSLEKNAERVSDSQTAADIVEAIGYGGDSTCRQRARNYQPC
jgi:hypothetical protein